MRSDAVVQHDDGTPTGSRSTSFFIRGILGPDAWSTEFEAFLRTALGHAATYSDDGSIHFVCMHWVKIRELLSSTADLYSETKNLCVWSKTNAGMGSLYRSRQ